MEFSCSICLCSLLQRCEINSSSLSVEFCLLVIFYVSRIYTTYTSRFFLLFYISILVFIFKHYVDAGLKHGKAVCLHILIFLMADYFLVHLLSKPLFTHFRVILLCSSPLNMINNLIMVYVPITLISLADILKSLSCMLNFFPPLFASCCCQTFSGISLFAFF